MQIENSIEIKKTMRCKLIGNIQMKLEAIAPKLHTSLSSDCFTSFISSVNVESFRSRNDLKISLM